MRRCLTLLALIAPALLTIMLDAAPASAQRIQWFVEVVTDPISQRPLLEAHILTREGYRFQLRRRTDNSIWGQFTLPRSSQATLTSDQLPVYRVDDHDPTDLELLKELESGSEPTLYKIEGRSIQFILWGDARKGFIPPVLRQMMLGKSLRITYFTILGESNEAEITLNRANEAIAQFLRVRPLNPDTDSVEQPTQTFSLVAKRFLELCEDMRFTSNDTDYTNCRQIFSRCAETADQTAESLMACLDFDPTKHAKPKAKDGDDEAGKKDEGKPPPRPGA